MLTVHPRELQIYRTQNGREPFTEWLESISDQRTQNRIQRRVNRLEEGNFGEINNTVLLLLGGGDKSSQTRDIERAKTYWLEYKEAQR